MRDRTPKTGAEALEEYRSRSPNGPKTKEAHPVASCAMSVALRVSIPSRTSASEELVVAGAERVGYWPTGLLASWTTRG